ncbi:MAG: helix-turn-helix domain-containing protein [Firmicutes bacterium]|nr:helix-turn-helix domain-containing protein [Bacillota bacterium]
MTQKIQALITQYKLDSDALLHQLQIDIANTLTKPSLKLPKMRTIPEAIKELKTLDPNNSLTQSILYRLTKSGELPSVKVGQKTLVDIDVLISYLTNSQHKKPPKTNNNPRADPEYGKVRKISILN